MKFIILFFVLSSTKITWANMACPFIWGTNSSTALTSKDIDIIRENLFIKIDRKFEEAKYRIQYFIETPKSGVQIPLLFFAKKYKGDFKVWIDDKEIEIKKIDEYIRKVKGTKFQEFDKYFDKPTVNKDDPETISVYWSEHMGDVIEISDLQYFEVNLSKGRHCIEVRYTSDSYTLIDQKDFFIYSLSPASFWKSFNKLHVEVDNTSFGREIKTNLGSPLTGKLDSVATWEFDKIPHKFLELTFVKEGQQKKVNGGNRKSFLGSGDKLEVVDRSLVFSVVIMLILSSSILVFLVLKTRKK